MSEIQDIAYKNIIDGYCYGYYGDFDVIIMMKNGYINATHLIKKVHPNDDFSRFNRGSNKKYIETCIKNTGLELDDLIIKVSFKRESLKDLTGTYCHKSVIFRVALWINDDFGYKASEIVNNYLIDDAVEKINKKYKKIVKQKQDKIDILTNTVNDFREENKKYQKKAILYQKKNNKLLSQLVIKSKQASIPTKNENLHYKFVILILSNVVKSKHYQFKFIRCQIINYKIAFNKIKEKYTNAKEFIVYENIPNSVNLGNLFKQEAGDKMIFDGNYFDLNPTEKNNYFDKEDLKEYSDSIVAMSLEVDLDISEPEDELENELENESEDESEDEPDEPEDESEDEPEDESEDELE